MTDCAPFLVFLIAIAGVLAYGIGGRAGMCGFRDRWNVSFRRKGR